MACEKIIKKSQALENFRQVYRLECKEHGYINQVELEPFLQQELVVNMLNDSWNDHIEHVLPLNLASITPDHTSSYCEPRVHRDENGYIDLHCKRHGLITSRIRQPDLAQVFNEYWKDHEQIKAAERNLWYVAQQGPTVLNTPIWTPANNPWLSTTAPAQETPPVIFGDGPPYGVHGPEGQVYKVKNIPEAYYVMRSGKWHLMGEGTQPSEAVLSALRNGVIPPAFLPKVGKIDPRRIEPPAKPKPAEVPKLSFKRKLG